MAKYKFPEGFLFGSATAAAQIEDQQPREGRGSTNWDTYYNSDKTLFFNEKYVMNDFLDNWKEDIDIAAKLNFNSLRIGVSFARIFPEGLEKTNQKGVDFYHKVFDYIKSKGITLIVTMYHFDMPTWVENKGGLLYRGVGEIFGKYAGFLAKEYKQPDMWATLNEPVVPVKGGYWEAFHYPAQTNFTESMKAVINMISIHLNMMKQIKANTNTKAGVVISVEPAIPATSSEKDVTAAAISDMLEWRSFADAMLLGKGPKDLQDFATSKGMWPEDYSWDIDKELLDDKSIRSDFLGVNYYQPLRIQANKTEKELSNDKAPIEMFYEKHEKEGIRMNPYRGWEIHPESVYDILMTVKEKYNNMPVYISENGMGVENEDKFRDENGMINDHYRIEFIGEHLTWINKAIDAGSNVFGYHMWTYIDNWSWRNAYKNRYGYIELDLETGKRKEKASASWIRNVIKTNTVDFE